ncbi:MAG TPA: sigma-70 family RNA polymerase sigma factor [Terriglobales bacterium]|nr:sigma-70 family RNA polymerase sigma factor [Terriglobales bacterium]
MLTKEALEKLLTCLDEDRERAGEKYQTLRTGLARFFEWRGCAFPEDHADEAIDRVARKIAQGEEIRNIQSYVTAVARFVSMEVVKEREKHQAALSLLPRDPVRQEPVDEDTRLECVRRCLQALAPESSQLIIAYYQDDGRNKIAVRKKLAQQLGISPHTLRMRLQRLRSKLEECVVDCLRANPAEANK